jgi:hypothetical protein
VSFFIVGVYLASTIYVELTNPGNQYHAVSFTLGTGWRVPLYNIQTGSQFTRMNSSRRMMSLSR